MTDGAGLRGANGSQPTALTLEVPAGHVQHRHGHGHPASRTPQTKSRRVVVPLGVFAVDSALSILIVAVVAVTAAQGPEDIRLSVLQRSKCTWHRRINRRFQGGVSFGFGNDTATAATATALADAVLLADVNVLVHHIVLTSSPHCHHALHSVLSRPRLLLLLLLLLQLLLQLTLLVMAAIVANSDTLSTLIANPLKALPPIFQIAATAVAATCGRRTGRRQAAG